MEGEVIGNSRDQSIQQGNSQTGEGIDISLFHVCTRNRTDNDNFIFDPWHCFQLKHAFNSQIGQYGPHDSNL
jgi:hypothetical protein